LHVRSFLAFNGAIIYWSGLWNLLDLYLFLAPCEDPEGCPGLLWRELGYMAAGLAGLVATNTFFAAAGLDDLVIRRDSPRYLACWDGPVRVFLRSLVSLSSCVVVWTGAYNIVDRSMTA